MDGEQAPDHHVPCPIYTAGDRLSQQPAGPPSCQPQNQPREAGQQPQPAREPHHLGREPTEARQRTITWRRQKIQQLLFDVQIAYRDTDIVQVADREIQTQTEIQTLSR